MSSTSSSSKEKGFEETSSSESFARLKFSLASLGVFEALALSRETNASLCHETCHDPIGNFWCQLARALRSLLWLYTISHIVITTQSLLISWNLSSSQERGFEEISSSESFARLRSSRRLSGAFEKDELFWRSETASSEDWAVEDTLSTIKVSVLLGYYVWWRRKQQFPDTCKGFWCAKTTAEWPRQ